jgi:hypothetical protein
MPASKSATSAEFEGTALDMAAEITRMTEEQKATRATLFTQFTARIFDEFSNLNRVVVQGHTPGFNDGDPCVHSQETYVSINGFAELNEEDEAFRYIDGDENPDLDWGERYVLNEGVDGFPFNGDLSAEDLGKVKAAFDAFESAIEDLYTTDFTLTWVRSKDDGKVTFSHDHYDCGY